MNSYREPVKIVVDKEVPTTVAALNKVLIVTHEKNADFKYYTSSADVATDFGNGSEVFKLVETYLSQVDGSGNILKPDFFAVIGVEGTKPSEKEAATEYAGKIKTALSEVVGETWYGLLTTANNSDMLPVLRPFLTENRKMYITETTTYPIDDTAKSDRILAIFNPTEGEYKAAAYAGAVITPGAGSKCSMVELSGVTADVKGGKKQELTQNNITFVEKRTSDGEVVANGGITTDSIYLDDVSAIDCIIVNLNENIEKVLIKKGFKQDDRGYALMEETLHNVMTEMGALGLIAVLNNNYEYIVYPINQTATERQQRLIRPRIKFRLAGWAYFIDVTLLQTSKDIGGAK